jgi:hypothetical protein
MTLKIQSTKGNETRHFEKHDRPEMEESSQMEYIIYHVINYGHKNPFPRTQIGEMIYVD